MSARLVRIGLFAAATAMAMALAPAVAAADGKGGPIGMTHNVSAGLQIGGLNNDVLADDQAPTPYDVSGATGFLRLRGGGYLLQSHYGHDIAMEGSFALGWIGKAAFTRPAEMPAVSNGSQTWGRLFLDLDISMLVDVVHVPPGFAVPGRLAFLAGWGMSTDFAYFYLGGRLAGAVGPVQTEIEYQRRFGESFSAPNLREERLRLNVYFSTFGTGLEWWHGYSEEAGGVASTSRAIRGGFNMITVNLVFVR